MPRTFILCLLLLAASLPAQGTLSVTIAASHPNSFNGTPGPGAAVGNVVRTEPLDIVLTAVPTIPFPPPAQLLPRPVLLILAPTLTPPLMIPQGLVHVNLGGAPPAATLIDSFNNPFHPTFGPALQGPSNTIALTLAANLFNPPYVLPMPALTLQAATLDTTGALVLSNPVTLLLIDPEISGFAPTVTGLAPPSTTPLGMTVTEGPEAGLNQITLQGTNFLAQSDWITFPPTVTFGGQQALAVSVTSNNTLVCIVPPVAMPTNPPFTQACFVDVTLTNHPALVNAPVTITSPQQYLYVTGLTPSVTGVVNAGTGMPLIADPRGGEMGRVLGMSFLDGLTLEFTHLPSGLATTLTTPPAMVGAAGLTIDFPTPVFCTGDVQLRVINCDQRFAAPVTFFYRELRPVLTSGDPFITTPPNLASVTFIRRTAASSQLTINGDNFLPATSPLATAPTVSGFYPTRAFIDGVLQSGIMATSATQMTGPTVAIARSNTQLFRPQLGFKELRIENPPCVATGNGAPISNLPCAPRTPPCTLVIQDDELPSLNSIFPAIYSAAGGGSVTLRGSNFFSVEAGVTEQDFAALAGTTSITTLDPTLVKVPAVFFGTPGATGRFSPRVRIISTTELVAEIPTFPAVTATNVQISVFNPDTLKNSNTVTFTFAPPLTDPTQILNPTVPILDAQALINLVIQGPILDPTDGNSPAVFFAVNPTPDADQGLDPLYPGGFPPMTVHNYMVLFNTRRATDGLPRRFDFSRIDLPATITLPGTATNILAPVATFDATIPAGAFVPVPAGRPLRVIVKALGFALNANGSISPAPTQNHPFFLQSHGDLRIDAMFDLGGDAFFIPTLNTTNPFRVRVDRTFAPAGSGRGGRGGSYFPEGLATLPGPNFGLSPALITGGSGERPATPLALSMVPFTSGTGGIGAAPIGTQAGGGAGAGLVVAGSNGLSGTAPGGFGGTLLGNATHLGSVTSAPLDDRFIYGTAPADFARFANGSAQFSGLFYGGSGGGAGGGSLALFVPAVSLGGRGGNGGGFLGLLSNGVLTLGRFGVIHAHGEQGRLGVEVFPVYNQNPFMPLNVPGAGGSGAGGTVFALAVAHICFEHAASAVCPPPLGGSVPVPASPLIDCRGAVGFIPPSFGQLGTAGGTGSPGRLRFAINDQSPYVLDLRDQLATMSTGLFNTLQGPVLPAPPMVMSIPLNFFSFPSP